MKITLLALALALPVLVCAQEFSTPIRINSDTTGIDSDPSMHVGPDGSIYVSWVKVLGSDMLGDIYFSRSDDNGNSFVPSVRATMNAEISPSLQRSPQFAIDIMGNIHMVWTELRVNEQHDIWYIRSTDKGKTWTEPVAVSADSSKYLQDFPAIACDSSGNTYISFIDSRDRGRGLSENEQLYMAKSTDYGLTWQAPRKVNNMPSAGGTCECCKQDIQAGRDGQVAIVFRSNLMNRRDIFAARSSDYGETFEEARPIQAQPWMLSQCPATGPNASLTPEGDLHVTWRDGRAAAGGKVHIYYDVLEKGKTETRYKLSNNVRIDQTETAPNWPDVTVYNGYAAIAYETSTDRASYVLLNSGLSPITFGALPGMGNKLFMTTEFAPDGTRYFTWEDEGYPTDDIGFVKDTMKLPPLSVGNEQKEEWFVTPNPVKAGNVVSLRSTSELGQYSIVDMLGRVVFRGNAQLTSDRNDIYVPELVAGQYILRLGGGKSLPVIVTN